MSRLLLKVLWMTLITALIAVIVWCYLTYLPVVPKIDPDATLLVEDQIIQEEFHELDGTQEESTVLPEGEEGPLRESAGAPAEAANEPTEGLDSDNQPSEAPALETPAHDRQS